MYSRVRVGFESNGEVAVVVVVRYDRCFVSTVACYCDDNSHRIGPVD
jgi:hypothetical protein